MQLSHIYPTKYVSLSFISSKILDRKKCNQSTLRTSTSGVLKYYFSCVKKINFIRNFGFQFTEDSAL